MIRSHRMHEDQIAGIAQTMKDLYQVRRIHSQPVMSGNAGRTAAVTMTIEERAERSGYPEPAPANPPAQRNIPSIRCIGCGDGFPITDYQYTKESGLCISCWEIKIGVVKCR